MTKRVLVSSDQTIKAFQALYRDLKPHLDAGVRFFLEVTRETRSNAQNRLLHATIAEIAKEREWCGRKWDKETWKRLLVAAWSRANGESVQVVPALDGHGVDMVPVRTSRLSRAECADLQTWIDAWRIGG